MFITLFFKLCNKICILENNDWKGNSCNFRKPRRDFTLTHIFDDFHVKPTSATWQNSANCHNFGNIGWYLKHDKRSDNNVVTKFRKTMNLQANLLANISEI